MISKDTSPFTYLNLELRFGWRNSPPIVPLNPASFFFLFFLFYRILTSFLICPAADSADAYTSITITQTFNNTFKRETHSCLFDSAATWAAVENLPPRTKEENTCACLHDGKYLTTSPPPQFSVFAWHSKWKQAKVTGEFVCPFVCCTDSLQLRSLFNLTKIDFERTRWTLFTGGSAGDRHCQIKLWQITPLPASLCTVCVCGGSGGGGFTWCYFWRQVNLFFSQWVYLTFVESADILEPHQKLGWAAVSRSRQDVLVAVKWWVFIVLTCQMLVTRQ